jgi:hypothetical protein
MLQHGGSDASTTILSGGGFTQPLAFVGNVAACSLQIGAAYYSNGRADIVQWDPMTLAPDPTTVALRTRAFGASELAYTHLRMDCSPPVVTRMITSVAEPPRETVAIDYYDTDIYNTQTTRYESDGDIETPEALQHPPGGPREPMSGPHPVLSHAVCGGDAVTQSLYVVQSVMSTNAIMDTSNYELMQRFRVTVPVKLHWVELAFAQNQPTYPYEPGLVAIFDATGATSPPTALPASLVEAGFYGYVGTPTWGSHYDFDQFITLAPDHDYWLLARISHDHRVYVRSLTGSEGAAFTSAIGPFFRRTNGGASWSYVPGRALDFRMIGVPIGVLAVPRPAPSANPLRLSVTPNPSRGAAFLTWSGATGQLRFDVIDARGRRVGGGSGASGPEGRWLWRGAAENGQALPAGVYFLRATDGAGHVAAQRVVLVR